MFSIVAVTIPCSWNHRWGILNISNAQTKNSVFIFQLYVLIIWYRTSSFDSTDMFGDSSHHLRCSRPVRQLLSAIFVSPGSRQAKQWNSFSWVLFWIPMWDTVMDDPPSANGSIRLQFAQNHYVDHFFVFVPVCVYVCGFVVMLCFLLSPNLVRFSLFRPKYFAPTAL